jgi:hypothetical protein
MKTLHPIGLHRIKLKYVGDQIPKYFQYSIHTRTRQVFDQLGFSRKDYQQIVNWAVSYRSRTSREILEIEVDICYITEHKKCHCVEPVWSLNCENNQISCIQCGTDIGRVTMDEKLVVKETEEEMKYWKNFTDSIQHIKYEDPEKFQKILDMYQNLYFETCADYVDIVSAIKKFIQ